jgi:hypothetical protein
MDEDLRVSDTSRRDFLKKSVAVGAAVWAAPTVMSLPAGRAWAQQYPVCNCSADAYGLFVSVLGQEVGTFGQATSCLLPAGPVGIAETALVTANLVCGSASSSVDGSCNAAAGLVSSVDIVIGPSLAPTLRVQASVLTSQASASCPPCSTQGTSSVATLTVSGSLVGGTISLNAVSTCNLDVGGLGLVIVNEQTCDADTLSVNALHVTVAGIAEVIVGHAEAGATGCGCVPCGTA